MRRRIRTLVVLAAVVALAATAATFGRPADASSPLGCPTTCLTGGLVGLGGKTIAVTGVRADSESRDYGYQWLALDLTEFPPLQVTLSIYIHTDGSTSNGVYTGSGFAAISGLGAYAYVYGLTLTDTGVTVNASGSSDGQSFTMAGTIVGGGVASYQSTYDYSWTGCGDGCGGGDG